MQLDLNDETNRKELEKHIDMNNYLLYLAIEFLSGNSDAIWANSEVWFYDTSKGEEESIYADGRARFLLYDMDMIYYSENTTLYVTCYFDRFKECFLDTDSLFKNVMSSKYYRNKFITLICDLINTSFKDENVIKIIDEEFAKIQKEMEIEYRGKTAKQMINEEFLKVYPMEPVEKYEEDFYEYVLNNVNNMKQVAINRDNEMLEEIETRYNLKEKYKLSITCEEGIKAYWNNMEVYGEETYSNEYYKNVNFAINFEEYPGYTFDHWLVNGKEIYEEKLEIEDELIENGEINILLCAKRNDNVKLIISEISAKDDSDWIKLTNIDENSIGIGDYYISDDINSIKKYRLPNITLKSNDSIIINGNKNYYAIGDYICNFNLSKGETLYLYNNIEEKIVDELKVPKMSKIETYGRYKNSNTMMYFNNTENQRKK